jgi:glycosyltransferase involved in cell wall biosynthesis
MRMASDIKGGEVVRTPRVSVVICSHNPRPDHIAEALAALAAQTLPYWDWELLLIDNASSIALAGLYDLSWHANARHIREDRLGVTHARMRGMREAKADLLVFVDDDNVPDSRYLSNAVEAFNADPVLGAAGGKLIPRYETKPPPWFAHLGISLACCDYGDELIEMTWPQGDARERAYPAQAPVTAGLAIRRKAWTAYLEDAQPDPVRVALGRRGRELTSGEDNDIVMCLLGRGWKLAYLPQLRLDHLIPAHRLSPQYLERYAYSSSKTWVQVLDIHGICPWRAISDWTGPLRKVRAYMRFRAWRTVENRIRWRGACGIIDGQVAIGARR